MFYTSSRPILSVVIIILCSFRVCLIAKSILFRSWFSYILFLIFLGGIIVLFIYICSVASNEQIVQKINKIYFISIIILTTLPYYINFNEHYLIRIKYVLINIYSRFSIHIIYITIVYLLLTLFVCVQVSKIKYGPVRTKKI